MTSTILRHTMSALAAIALVSAFTSTPAAAQGLSLRELPIIERGLLIDVGDRGTGHNTAFRFQLKGTYHTGQQTPKGLTTKKRPHASGWTG